MPRLGPKAFEQAAGFLRIPGGDDPLDASAVHPEAYPVVRRMLESTGQELTSLIGNTAALQAIRPADFVDDTFGLPTVTDILQRARQARTRPAPDLQDGHLQGGRRGDQATCRPGMTLEGVVTNVAAFGAFIDIGVHQDGLAHVSALSKSFVRDPRDVVKPGDVVMVKVLDVDVPRKRISLTLRLDDEVPADGAASERAPGWPAPTRPARPRRAGAVPVKALRAARAGAGQGGRPPRRDEAPPDSAMADALRRAGFTG